MRPRRTARGSLLASLLVALSIAGCMPFDGTPVEVAQKYLNVAVPPFATRVPGIAVARDVERLCLQLTAAQRDHRPPNARAAMTGLDALART